MSDKAPKLHLLPVQLGDNPITTWLPPDTQQIAAQLRYYIAENAKTARAYLKTVGTQHTIRDITIQEINAQTPHHTIRQWLQDAHEDIGVVSEAGCPAVADPGANVVAVAHQLGWQVVPHIGPSSILLGLMASGLNGQQFAFHGYAPIKPTARQQTLKQWEQQSSRWQQTQILIETPYRNQAMFLSLCQSLHDTTQLCIACHINSSQEWIKTQTIAQWKQGQPPVIDKQPCLFLFLAQP